MHNHGRKGGIVHRIAEAELWGIHSDLLVMPGLTVRQAVGLYGTIFEIQCTSLWRLWRLHAHLAQVLPLGAEWRVLHNWDTDDNGVCVIHFWMEATRDHVTTGGHLPAPSIRQPTEYLD